MAGPQFLTVAISLLAGLAFGVLYFRILRASVHQLVTRASSGASTGRQIGLTLVRIAVAGAFAFLLALWGAAALLAGFAGFLAARALALRAARRQG